MTDVRKHDAWIRASGWDDGRDIHDGLRYSHIGQPGDFHAGVREYLTAQGRLVRGRRVPVTRFDWHVTRQFTDRQPRDRAGSTGLTTWPRVRRTRMAHARSAATRELKRLRAEHIAAGMSATAMRRPADQIRAAMAGKMAGR